MADGFKTMGLRLSDAVHAQLTALAQLQGVPLNDVLHQAVADYLEAKRRDPAMTAKAEALLAEFDRETQARRGAIAGLFGQLTEGEPVQPSGSGRKPSRTTEQS